MRMGWRAEVAALLATGHREDLEALRPLGYAELMDSGEVISGMDHPVDRIVQATQAYAKRQATWFRNQLTDAPRWDPDTESLAAAFAKLGLS